MKREKDSKKDHLFVRRIYREVGHEVGIHLVYEGVLGYIGVVYEGVLGFIGVSQGLNRVYSDY